MQSESEEPTLEEKRLALRNKILAIGRMSRMFQVLREDAEQVERLKNMNEGVLPKGSLSHGREGLENAITTFEDARKADLANEALPPTIDEREKREQERQQRIKKELDSNTGHNPVFSRLIRKLSG